MPGFIWGNIVTMITDGVLTCEQIEELAEWLKSVAPEKQQQFCGMAQVQACPNITWCNTEG